MFKKFIKVFVFRPEWHTIMESVLTCAKRFAYLSKNSLFIAHFVFLNVKWNNYKLGNKCTNETQYMIKSQNRMLVLLFICFSQCWSVQFRLDSLWVNCSDLAIGVHLLGLDLWQKQTVKLWLRNVSELINKMQSFAVCNEKSQQTNAEETKWEKSIITFVVLWY